MNWQKLLAQGFANANDLLDYLNLDRPSSSSLSENQFKTRVPLGFAKRMKPGDRNDPLLKQVLALDEELKDVEGYVIDPLAERLNNPRKGLIHKYAGRVLLTLTTACAVHCRYCFRRHFPYDSNNPGWTGWQETLSYIEKDPSIHEVILSGGDPLLASNIIFKKMLDKLASVPHIKTLRIHSRVPIVLPERIDDEFIELMSSCNLRKVMVLHCNHPQELDNSVLQVCRSLKAADVYLLNQAVLLKDINDSVTVLQLLSETLFDYGVLPYYLHVLDKVLGTHHFDLPEENALLLYRNLQAVLPGYLLPRLAREEPFKPHKTLLV